MKKLKTANYLQKKIIYLFFSEEWYHKIKLLKIIWSYKLGRPYEMSTLFKYILPKDGIVLDIGANMGQYASRLHNIVEKGNGHIHSFEPVNVNYISLQAMKKILNLKNLTINKLGVSNVVEDTSINIPMFDNGLIVGTRATLLNIDGSKYRTEQISVTTIDNYVSENKISRIDFIKCDTEGNEINVLEGGRETIKTYLPILSFEMSYKKRELNWLKDLGYEQFYHDTKYDKLRKINNYQQGNLILINKKHKESLNKIIE